MIPEKESTPPVSPWLVIWVVGSFSLLFVMLIVFVFSYSPPANDSSDGTKVRPSPTTTTVPPSAARRPDVLNPDGNPVALNPNAFPPDDPRSRLSTAEDVKVYNGCLAEVISGPACVVLGGGSSSLSPPPPLPPQQTGSSVSVPTSSTVTRSSPPPVVTTTETTSPPEQSTVQTTQATTTVVTTPEQTSVTVATLSPAPSPVESTSPGDSSPTPVS